MKTYSDAHERRGLRHGGWALVIFSFFSWSSLSVDAAPPPRRLAQAESVSEADKAAALAATREGNRLLDAGKAEEALAKFQKAHQLVGGDKLHYNLGQALRAIPGREVEAFIEFDTFLERVPNAPLKLVESAAAERATLGALLGFITVETTPDEASVSVCGRAVGKTPLGQPVVVQPGRCVVRIEKPGYVTVEDAVVVGAGQRIPRSFVLVAQAPLIPLPAASAAMEDSDRGSTLVKTAAARDADGQPESHSGLLSRWWFWTIVGVVAAGAAAAVYLTRGTTTKFTCPSGVDHCESLP